MHDGHLITTTCCSKKGDT